MQHTTATLPCLAGQASVVGLRLGNVTDGSAKPWATISPLRARQLFRLLERYDRPGVEILQAT